MISSIIGFFTRIFCMKAVESINLTNPATFQTFGKVTMGFSKDIYPNSKANIGFDNDFSIFETQPQYTQYGKIVKKVGADANEYMPKMIFWDMKGNESTQVKGARILAIRGSQSYQEWFGNFDCKEVSGKELGIDIDGVFHKNFGTVALKIWNKYKKLILKSKYPVIITGHSRGAGIAEILYVIAKNEINKKKLNLPIYCMAYAPPPSMSLNDANLTRDIHAFVYGNDAVPRFFVSDFISYYNKYKKISNVVNYAASLLSPVHFVRNGFSNDDAAKIGRKIASYFPQINESIIVNAIVDKKDDLYKIMEDLNFDPNKVKIKEHVGTIYHINGNDLSKKSDNNDDKCMMKPITDAKLENPKKLSQLNAFKFWEIKSFANDHNPKLYQQAFNYPVCSI